MADAKPSAPAKSGLDDVVRAAAVVLAAGWGLAAYAKAHPPTDEPTRTAVTTTAPASPSPTVVLTHKPHRPVVTSTTADDGDQHDAILEAP